MRLTSALLALALEAAPDAAAAAATVVDHVAREERLLPAVYLARGGRLRCAALRGYWQARDGLPGSAGIMGRTFRTATEVVVPDVTASADYLEANPGVVAEACFPVLAGGVTAGVLNIESREPLRDSDLEHLRDCAAALGARIEDLGGLPSESDTQRLLRHVADMAALQDADAVADALLVAALDLVPLGSALLARTSAGGLRPSCAAGPLAPILRAAPLEAIGAWVQDGISCFTVGSPDAPPAANLAELRAAGVETLVAVGLYVQGELLGALVLASNDLAGIDTDDVELLEQLATHGAACLRTAELMGSLRERAESDPLTGLGHHATFHEALATSHRRPTTAGSLEARTRAPRSSPCTKSPTATIVSTPAARSSARLAAGGASGEPTVKHEMPSWTQSPIAWSSAARRTGASGPAAHDGRRPPPPVVRASSAEPSGTRSSAAFSSAWATASASCSAAMTATWRSRRCVADSVGSPPRASRRSPRARAHSRRYSRSLSRSGSRDSTLSTPTVSPQASTGKHASATTPGLASR